MMNNFRTRGSLPQHHQQRSPRRRRSRQRKMILLGGAAIVLLVGWNSMRARSSSTIIPSSSSLRRQAPPRIAILLPYVSGRHHHHDEEDEDEDRNSPPPPYLSTVFCTSAQAVADTADFFVIYSGDLLDQNSTACRQAPNIRWINVGSDQALARRLLRVLEPPNQRNNVTEKATVVDDRLVAFVAAFVRVYPYGLVEFKPALGHIFNDLIQGYSHWAYADLDMLWGDLGRWIVAEEWNYYHLVTYTYGDQHRLYLRGQFTMHRNVPLVNQLWRGCNYLTGADERFRRIMNQESHYERESAEGCYSDAVLRRKDIRVKFAAGKAWTDTPELLDQRVAANLKEHGVFSGRETSSSRQVLYRVPIGASADLASQVSQLKAGWWRKDKTYRNRRAPLERPVGSMQTLRLKPQGTDSTNCMYWVLPRYQDLLCVDKEDVASDENVFWLDGQLYKQKRQIVKHGIASTAPMFHYQDWKRDYRYSQLTPFLSDASTVRLTENGVVPIIDRQWNSPSKWSKKLPFHRVPSPLGLKPAKWHGVQDGDRSQLPSSVYCLETRVDDSKKRTECTRTASLRNSNSTWILAPAVGWKHVHFNEDVTLHLTLQTSVDSQGGHEALKSGIQLIRDNLDNWYGQPSVIVLFVSGATPQTADVLQAYFAGDFAIRHENTFVVALLEESRSAWASRKTLLNMAMDVTPTRWFVGGLELERGLVISSEAAFWSTRAATVYRQIPGNLFYIPQFALSMHADASSKGAEVELPTLWKAQQEKLVKSVSEYEPPCTSGTATLQHHDQTSVFRPVISLWWGHSTLTNKTESSVTTHEPSISQHARVLEDFSLLLMERNQEQYKHDEYSIFLFDNMFKDAVQRTNEIAREVEELDGPVCFSHLRTRQLLTLGYDLNVLSNVFAASTESTRKAASPSWPDRCLAKCRFGGDAQDGIEQDTVTHKLVLREDRRAVETALQWMS